LAAASAAAANHFPQLNPSTLTPFVDPLPLLPAAKPAGHKYRMVMREIRTKLHRDLPPTRLWAYGGSVPGPTIEVRAGQGIDVEWVNELPSKHFLPIDHALCGAAASSPEVRAVVHVHGAKVPPESDGYPEEWYTPGKSATVHYPNQQEAAALWYHDHAMGITRLNIYAGLFGLYVVRDAVEDALNLPRGQFEIPLVLCDRLLLRDGQLDYPVSGKADAPWVPEAFGNAMMVNGKLFPYLDVEPRKYRFRLLNAANGRFFHLSLSNGMEFHQIGTDQGLVPAPIALRDFVLAPGERMDVIVDFRDCAGERIVLANDAFQMMQFRVSKNKSADSSSLPSQLRPVARTAESSATQTRLMTINECQNMAGEPTMMLLNGKRWSDPITERPELGSTEVWTILNTTDDSHPIHLHLVRFQILDRRPIAIARDGALRYTGPAALPEAYEAGWKDTARAHSMMVTRIITRFDGYVGRYVWHCHVLEHEDNEMMRPYEVVAPGHQAG
jgi:spore coat protein A, manganese oxidase